MESEREIHGFSYILYFVGLHRRISLSSSKSRVLNIFPIVFYSLLVALAGALCVHAQSQLSKFPVVVDTVATYLLIGSECILHFLVIVQTFIRRENFKNLYRKYVSMQNYISHRVKHPIRFDDFFRTSRRLTVAVLTPFVLTLCARKTIYSREANVPLETGLMTLQFASSLVQLHTIIHVSLLNFFFMFSSSVLTVNGLRSANIVGLRQLKLFHFKLWKISTHINCIFGWSTMAIIFRNYFEVFYSVLSVYWILLYAADESGWVLLRKFILPN